MRKLMIAGLVALSAVAVSAPVAGTAQAAEVTVQMLSFDKDTKMSNSFKPLLVKINKGDTVKWVATQGGHNVAFVTGGVPAGVAAFSSPMGKDVAYKFDRPGVYVYKCTPHVGMGMVGVVFVGKDKSNLDAAKAAWLPPAAKKRLEPVFAEIAK